MAVVYALEQLYRFVKVAVEATFAYTVTVDGKPVVHVSVPCDWGQTRPAVQTNVGIVGRVVFVPGALDGDMGELVGAKQWAQPAKPLYCLQEPFQVYVYGHDPTAKSANDPKHDHAAFRVLHEVIRQIRLISQNPAIDCSPVVLKNPKILKPQGVHILGREYLLQGLIEQPILDMIDDDSPTIDVSPANAALTDTLGNHSEVSHVESE